MHEKKVLIAPSQFGVQPQQRLVEMGFHPVENPFHRKLTEEEVISLLQGVPGIIAGLEPLNRKVMQATNLRVISRCGSGMDNVDSEAAREFGIQVFSTPNGPTTAVAEATLGAIFALLREFHLASEMLHSKRWEKRTGFQLRGKQVAIIGFGRIGREVARLFLAFGARVVVADPAVPEEVVREAGCRLLPLDEILPTADVVTLHANGSQCLLTRERLAKMKPGSFLLNAARGGLVDEVALLEMLGTEIIRGAWLDVFSKEPYQGPLLGHPRVLLTPHIASYTHEGRESMEMESVENLIRGFGEK